MTQTSTPTAAPARGLVATRRDHVGADVLVERVVIVLGEADYRIVSVETLDQDRRPLVAPLVQLHRQTLAGADSRARGAGVLRSITLEQLAEVDPMLAAVLAESVELPEVEAPAELAPVATARPSTSTHREATMPRTDPHAPALIDLALLEQVSGQLTVDEVLDDLAGEAPAVAELIDMCPGRCPGDYLEAHGGRHLQACVAAEVTVERDRAEARLDTLREGVAAALGMDVAKPIPTDDQLAADVAELAAELERLREQLDEARNDGQATAAQLGREVVEARAEVGRLRGELQQVYGWLRDRPFEPVARSRFHAEQTELERPVWVVVDDYGMGVVAAGPFGTAAEASSYDPTDDRFEVRVMTTGQYRAGARPWHRDVEGG